MTPIHLGGVAAADTAGGRCSFHDPLEDLTTKRRRGRGEERRGIAKRKRRGRGKEEGEGERKEDREGEGEEDR